MKQYFHYDKESIMSKEYTWCIEHARHYSATDEGCEECYAEANED